MVFHEIYGALSRGHAISLGFTVSRGSGVPHRLPFGILGHASLTYCPLSYSIDSEVYHFYGQFFNSSSPFSKSSVSFSDILNTRSFPQKQRNK